MALTIETGAGVAGADSYETVDDCSAYAVRMFGQALNGNNADKEAALRRAFRFMDTLPWKGTAVYPQAQAWPRYDVYDERGNYIANNTIPQAIKDAQSLFARAEFQDSGCLQPSVTTGGQKVLTKLDVMEWQVIGASGAEAQRKTVLQAIDRLKPYLINGGQSGGSMHLMRG